jgi:hypothetical protein
VLQEKECGEGKKEPTNEIEIISFLKCADLLWILMLLNKLKN